MKESGKVSRKTTIEIPEPMAKWLNEVVQENPFLGSVEEICLEAIRDKMWKLQKYDKRRYEK